MWWNCCFRVLNNIHTYIRTSSIPFLWEWYCVLGFFFRHDSSFEGCWDPCKIFSSRCCPVGRASWSVACRWCTWGICCVPRRLLPRWPGSRRGTLVRSAAVLMEVLLEVVCCGWAALRVWVGGWVWCVLVLNTIPEVVLLWFSHITTGKYWIFDVCLAESFPSSVFCTSCICHFSACFPVTLSSLTVCCSPSTNEMISCP